MGQMWCSGVDAERGWRVCSLCVDGWSALQQGADRRMRPGPVTTCVHTTTVHVQPQSMLEIEGMVDSRLLQPQQKPVMQLPWSLALVAVTLLKVSRH